MSPRFIWVCMALLGFAVGIPYAKAQSPTKQLPVPGKTPPVLGKSLPVPGKMPPVPGKSLPVPSGPPQQPQLRPLPPKLPELKPLNL